MIFPALSGLLTVAAAIGAQAAPRRLVTTRDAANCTVTQFSQVSAAVSSCSAIVISNLSVPANTTLDLTKVKKNTTITFEGTTTFGFAGWAGPLISVAGTNITVSGGTLDGQGQLYWDGQGSNGGIKKPKFFYAHKMNDSIIRDLTIKNSPVQTISVDNSNFLTFSNIVLDSSAGTQSGLGHNTDGFDVGESTYVNIQDTVVLNQDDCIAVNSGSDLYFAGMYCSGGHGLSIGSVGGRTDNVVSNVTFTDSVVVNSQNGVRIKTVYNATGTVSDVTYANIALWNISNYGVVIEQDYENGSPTGVPTNGVPITNLTLKNVVGTAAPDAQDYYILCATDACSDWTFSIVDVVGGKNNSCNYSPAGFLC